MKTTPIEHKSRTADIVINYPATENNLSWPFTPKSNGELFDVTLSNVASYTIGGLTHAISPNNPYPVTAGVDYMVAITKVTNGQPASITIKSRRAVNETTTISVPDFSDLTVTSNYVLLTNTGNNGQVVVLQNSNVTPANYTGAGVFTNSIIRGIVNLPDIATPFGTPAFSWTCCIHAKHQGNDRVLVIGHATANNTTRGRAVCLIDPTSLAVTNLDGVANTYTYISNTGPADSAVQNASITTAENFVNNKILLSYNNTITELDINNKTWVTNVYPLTGWMAGFGSTYTEHYYNPVDGLVAGSHGQFNTSRGQHYSDASANGLYDYNRNVKLGTVSYWGRWRGTDKNGLLAWSVENSTLSGTPNCFGVKNNIIAAASPTYIGFIRQDTGAIYREAHINKNWTSIGHPIYVTNDGNTWIFKTNTTRLLIMWINRETNTITQGYYDLQAVTQWYCTDKILISK